MLVVDIKPGNILVDWTCDEEDIKTITKVALGDFDIAFNLEPGALLHATHAVGNAMWRSLEGQTGRGLSKASDVYSFGLVVSNSTSFLRPRMLSDTRETFTQCLYVLGAGETILINDYEELAKLGIAPEQEILTRHFPYFCSANDGLLKQIDSEKLSKALKLASQMDELAVEEQPEMIFDVWGQELGSGTQNMIAEMMKPDPRAGMTIDQIMAHPWWEEEF